MTNELNANPWAKARCADCGDTGRAFWTERTCTCAAGTNPMTSKPETNTRAGEVQARQLATALMGVERFTADGDFHPDYLAMLARAQPFGKVHTDGICPPLRMPSDGPVFTPEEEADLVAQINGNWYLQPNPQPSELVERLLSKHEVFHGGGTGSLHSRKVRRNPDGLDAANHITQLEAQIANLQADKWDVRHTSTMNDLVQMGMARDAAIEDAAKLQADGDKLAGAGEVAKHELEASKPWFSGSRSALASITSAIDGLTQALTEWKDRA